MLVVIVWGHHHLPFLVLVLAGQQNAPHSGCGMRGARAEGSVAAAGLPGPLAAGGAGWGWVAGIVVVVRVVAEGLMRQGRSRVLRVESQVPLHHRERAAEEGVAFRGV